MSEEIKTLKFLTGIAVDPAVEIVLATSINDLTDVETFLRPPALNDKLFWDGEYWIPESGIEKGYVFGGRDQGTLASIDDVGEYFTDDTWAAKNDYDGGSGTFIRATKVKFLGYCLGSGGDDRALRSYNRAADTYSILTGGPPGEGLSGSAIEPIDGNFYTFGGFGDGGGGPNNSTHEYNPDSDVWTEKTILPDIGRVHASSFTLNDKAYICYGIGGVFTSDTVNDVDEYDPDTWTSKTDAPSESRWLLASTHIGQKGYTFGGLTDSGGVDGVNETFEYDPMLNSWATMAVMPGDYKDNGAFTLAQGTRAYSVGGFISQGDDTNEYVPDTWTARAAIPAPSRGKFGSTEI